jgi:hypothetical protein
MMSEFAILMDGVVLPVDLMTWARWFGTADRTVAKTTVGDTEVSTVFIGANHAIGNGSAKWFETLCFGGASDGEMERYTTLEEAMIGHEQMVACVQAAQRDAAVGDET